MPWHRCLGLCASAGLADMFVEVMRFAFDGRSALFLRRVGTPCAPHEFASLRIGQGSHQTTCPTNQGTLLLYLSARLGGNMADHTWYGCAMVGHSIHTCMSLGRPVRIDTL